MIPRQLLPVQQPYVAGGQSDRLCVLVAHSVLRLTKWAIVSNCASHCSSLGGSYQRAVLLSSSSLCCSSFTLQACGLAPVQWDARTGPLPGWPTALELCGWQGPGTPSHPLVCFCPIHYGGPLTAVALPAFAVPLFASSCLRGDADLFCPGASCPPAVCQPASTSRLLDCIFAVPPCAVFLPSASVLVCQRNAPYPTADCLTTVAASVFCSIAQGPPKHLFSTPVQFSAAQQPRAVRAPVSIGDHPRDLLFRLHIPSSNASPQISSQHTSSYATEALAVQQPGRLAFAPRPLCSTAHFGRLTIPPRCMLLDSHSRPPCRTSFRECASPLLFFSSTVSTVFPFSLLPFISPSLPSLFPVFVPVASAVAVWLD